MFKSLAVGLMAVALLAGTLPNAGFASEEIYRDGEHYRTLARALPRSVEDPGKVEVLEFFWYGCPHCFDLEPYLESWVEDGMPESAEFVQVPATLNPSWEIHARAFYIAKSLDVLGELHGRLMEAIHLEGNPLNDKDSLAEFFEEHGVEPSDFEKTYASFAVETGMRRATFLGERAGIRAVPSIIVGGKYETSISTAGGPEALLDVIDYLVALEAEEAS